MIRERILVMGGFGSGKTHQFLLTARALPESRIWIIDTDDSYPRMFGTEFKDLESQVGSGPRDRIRLYQVYDWKSYVSAKDEIVSKAQEGDWVSIDMASSVWQAVQGYFVQAVFEQNIEDYFIEARKILASRGDKTAKGREAKNLGALKGWLDWPVVNKLYDSFILPLTYQCKGHLYIATKAQNVSSDDDGDVQNLYGSYGVKPAGQKDLGYQAQTVFLLQQGKQQGKWEISTVKDRGRKMYDHAPLVSLPRQYLGPTAGFDI